ncbi:MAG TPA: hypothetical protein VGC41_15760 [Kofleriaceae bacterium]
MQRTWATGGENDRGPLEWVGAIVPESKVVPHIRVALDAAAAPDATIAQGQAGLLAIEAVTYIHGGDADLDPVLHMWLRDMNPTSDEALRKTALDVLAKLRAGSALAAHWATEPVEKQDAWRASLDNLQDRLTTAKRKPDPRKDPRIIAFAKNFHAAKKHLRVALAPYAITDEPIVHILVAPGLSVVVHYAEVGDLEPVAVPIEHARAWNKTAKAIAKLAAKQTREVSELRTHILENEGFEINLAFGNSSFTAGLLPYASLLLAEGITAPHGMIVAAPNAGTVVYHRIADEKWNPAAVEIISQVREIYMSSKERISPKLWWWHEGEVTELPYTVIADNIMIEPVAEFVDAMAKLNG